MKVRFSFFLLLYRTRICYWFHFSFVSLLKPLTGISSEWQGGIWTLLSLLISLWTETGGCILCVVKSKKLAKVWNDGISPSVTLHSNGYYYVFYCPFLGLEEERQLNQETEPGVSRRWSIWNFYSIQIVPNSWSI